MLNVLLVSFMIFVYLPWLGFHLLCSEFLAQFKSMWGEEVMLLSNMCYPASLHLVTFL